MTPSVAFDFVRKLVSARQTFMANVNATRAGIEKLGVQGDAASKTTPQAELSFQIPRTLFGNRLGSFAKELVFIDRMLMDLTEAVTAERKPIEVERLSTSDPTVTAAACFGAALLLGKIIEKFLDVWKKVEEIREIRQRLDKIGMGNTAAVEELTGKIQQTIDAAAEESVNQIMESSPVVQDGRKNELRNALRKDTHRLYFEIERGLNVEIKVSSDAPAADEEAKAEVNELRAVSMKLQYPQITGEPILRLPAGSDENDSQSASNSRAGSSSPTALGKKPKKAKKAAAAATSGKTE
jgi:hypothetical protein